MIPREEAVAEPVADNAPPAAAACDQALADLGDRLEWLKGLVEEIVGHASAGPPAHARLQEIAHMMQESMAEAGALHRALGEHIAGLRHDR
jgi:hypothetical protein